MEVIALSIICFIPIAIYLIFHVSVMENVMINSTYPSVGMMKVTAVPTIKMMAVSETVCVMAGTLVLDSAISTAVIVRISGGCTRSALLMILQIKLEWMA